MSAAVQDRALLAFSIVLLLVTTASRCFVSATAEGGTVASLVVPILWLTWVVGHSVVVRGGSLTARYLLIAAVFAFGLEAVEVNWINAFHHTVAPQVLGVPLQTVMVRVVYLYAGLTMA